MTYDKKPITTICLFACIGVEDTGYATYRKVKEGEPGYTENDSHVYTDRVTENGFTHDVRYKNIQTPFNAQNIRLVAQYDPNNAEHVKFANATPSGEMKFYVDNPDVIGTFKPGRKYYITLTPIEE
jgi:hypothetical protein